MPPAVQIQVVNEFTMGAWGQRFFESDHDYDIVEELTNDSGFGHIVYQKKQWLLLPKHPVKVRKHMNSGGLVKIFNVYAGMLSDYKTMDLKSPQMDGALIDSPRYYLLLLGMLAIDHGWKIDGRFCAWLRANYANMALNRGKEAQAKKALEEFENGKPYKLGSLGLYDMQLEVTLMADAEHRARGSVHPGGVSVFNTITIRSLARMLHDNKVAMILGASKEKGVDILYFGKDRVADNGPGTSKTDAGRSAQAGGKQKSFATDRTTKNKVTGAVPADTWREDLRKQNKPRSREFYSVKSPLAALGL